MLHYKSNSDSITVNDFKIIFEKTILNISFPTTIDLNKKILEIIFECAEECLTASTGINLEHKIVMSIAIRIKAEHFMKSKITDQTFLNNVDNNSNQTWSLLKKYAEEFNNEKDSIEILKRVNLITPENIHINSFMYEPILDMGDNELRELYKLVKDKLVI
ncbi:MAG: hypothetical protein NTV62_01500 [Candidatus Gribaldobacteria bacterium]|nr:hypothetical protein [Candidatus Gribaldobacteria bacterium]